MTTNPIKQAIIEGVRDNLDIHIGTILGVFDTDGMMTISIPVKLPPGRNGAIQIETGINFVEKRVKDANTRVVERNQVPLPGMEKKGYAIKAGVE